MLKLFALAIKLRFGEMRTDESIFEIRRKCGPFLNL